MQNLTADEEEYQDYFRKIELGWSLARGCQIIISPLEFEEVDKWHEAGIPLPVVLRAIELFIEKKRNAKRKRSFLLKDATSTVEKCWKEYQDIHAGETEEGDLLVNKMKSLVRKVQKLAKAHEQHKDYIDQLITDMKAIPLLEIVDFDSIDRALAELEVGLVQAFTEGMPEEERNEIRDEVSEFLAEDEDPEFFAKMLNDAVRSYFGLPKLTLLG